MTQQIGRGLSASEYLEMTFGSVKMSRKFAKYGWQGAGNVDRSFERAKSLTATAKEGPNILIYQHELIRMK